MIVFYKDLDAEIEEKSALKSLPEANALIFAAKRVSEYEKKRLGKLRIYVDLIVLIKSFK